MAWWSGSLGGLQDIAGAVTKISESVKNIEKNFDSALGLEEKRDDEEGSGSRTSNSDGMGFFNPVMAFMGHNGEESSTEVSEKQQLPQHSPAVEENHKVTTKPATSEADASEVPPVITQAPKEPSELEENVSSSTAPPVSMADVSDQSIRPQSPTRSSAAEENHDGSTESPTSKRDTSEVSETQQSPTRPSIVEETFVGSIETSNSIEKESQDHQDTENSDLNDEALPSQPDASIRDIRGDRTSSPNKLDQSSDIGTEESIHAGKEDTDDGKSSRLQPADSMVASSDDVNEAEVKIVQELDIQKEIISPQENSDIVDKASHGEVKVHDGETNTAENGEENDQTEEHAVSVVENEDTTMIQLENVSSKSIIVDNDPDLQNELVPASAHVPVGPLEVGSRANDLRKEEKIQDSVTTMNSLESVGSVVELEKLKRDMKMMDAALQGAARQSQSKADEIARLMNENEQLKSTIDELKGKSVEAEMDALKDEYHQRVATLERKVYALTKERDTLRREQNKKSDAAALLKEKDEIITQVMAEGEELSKKQAAQEATIRKLRAQLDS
ncbi:hypothetical protein ACQ4PT_033237 [Festuca glaucescens]